MANTDIADLGPNIKLDHDYSGTNSDPAYGDGSLKAGAIVSINSTTGKVQGIDTNSGGDSQLRGIGVLREQVPIDIDTAITDMLPCKVDFPKDGDLYRIRISDPVATYYKNHPLGLTTVAGELAIITDISDLSNVVAYLDKYIATGDTVAEVRWA